MKEKNTNEKLEKVKIVSIWILSILLLINIFQKSGVINSIQNASKKLSSNGEMISEEGEVAKTVNASNWDTSKVTVTKDAEGKDVPVPKGYVGSSVEGENKIKEGYVIYEGTAVVNSSNVASAKISRNQWVWVPVPDPSRIYEEVNGVKKAKLYAYTTSGRVEYQNNNYEPGILSEIDSVANLTNGGLTGMTPDKLHQELQQEFDSTIESIKRYGGFYVGRYETGNLSQSRPVVRKMNTDIANQTWYTMYSRVGYLAANSNVKTNIIWGCLWDEILQWMVDKWEKWPADYVTGGAYWGNCLDSNFSYINSNGQTVTKPAGQNIKIPTGSAEHAKASNIYDMCGNTWEFTLEGMKPFRTVRGSACQQKEYYYSGGSRSTARPNEKYDITGCRAYLYIK